MHLSAGPNPTMPTCSAVLLIHNAGWVASQDHWVLSPRITLGNFEGSRFVQIYHRLVRERHLDGGVPLDHRAYALIDLRGVGRYGLSTSTHEPDCVITQLANLIAIMAGVPLTYSRQIVSADGFRADLETEALHVARGQQDSLETHGIVFTDERLAQLTRAWATVTALRPGEGGQHLAGALGYFSEAWQAHALDETCLHLAAVLEALFAPPGTLGTPAEITRAMVRCVGGSAEERARLGRLVQQFYEVRADFVEVPYESAAIDAVVAVFQEVALLLERILTTPALVAVFTSEPARVQWLGAGPAQ